MNTLKKLRAHLGAVAQSAGISYMPHLEGRFSPPMAFTIPGSPYLERGDTFGSFKVNMQLLLVADTRSNDMTTEGLDQLITRALVALHDSDWIVQDVSDPAGVTIGGAEYLAAFVSVQMVTAIDDGR